jgi:hypothetical protein
MSDRCVDQDETPSEEHQVHAAEIFNIHARILCASFSPTTSMYACVHASKKARVHYVLLLFYGSLHIHY